ncbi:MAG: LptF/LptG family permease [Gemmatimonadaceae bacterium]|nr:LptF/LptG family permease [Gemmatimonadaceae bacterium]
MRIISKYILREHAGPLVFALSALTSLLLLNYVAKRLGDLVGKGLPWQVIVEFFALSIPFTVAMTLPMAVLVATLHAFSRFAAENEITAFKASGVSMHTLMRPVMIAAGILTLFMVWFNDQLLPAANHRLSLLTTDIARKKPTFALKEQIINPVVPGKLFLRAGRIASLSNEMTDVAIYDLADPAKRRVIYADRGTLEMVEGVDLKLTLRDGSMEELSTMEPTRLQRSFFVSNVVKVRGVGNDLERDQSGDDYKSDRELTICELEHRVQQEAVVRDSAWRNLAKVNARLAKPLKPTPVPVSMGGWYCGMLRRVLPSALGAQAPAPPAGAPAPVVAPATLPAVAIDTSPVFVESIKARLTDATFTIDAYQVEIEKKFAIAVACFVFVLLGAPIALRFPRGGVGLTIGVSLAVFGLYYVGLSAGETLANRNILDPFWAMWAANFLLGGVGLVLTLRLGSEGSTARGSETTEWWSSLRARFTRRRAS